MTKKNKNDFIVARIQNPIKQKIKEAADLQGISVSAFIILHSLAAAKKIIKNN